MSTCCFLLVIEMVWSAFSSLIWWSPWIPFLLCRWYHDFLMRWDLHVACLWCEFCALFVCHGRKLFIGDDFLLMRFLKAVQCTIKLKSFQVNRKKILGDWYVIMYHIWAYFGNKIETWLLLLLCPLGYIIQPGMLHVSSNIYELDFITCFLKHIWTRFYSFHDNVFHLFRWIRCLMFLYLRGPRSQRHP